MISNYGMGEGGLCRHVPPHGPPCMFYSARDLTLLCRHVPPHGPPSMFYSVKDLTVLCRHVPQHGPPCMFYSVKDLTLLCRHVPPHGPPCMFYSARDLLCHADMSPHTDHHEYLIYSATDLLCHAGMFHAKTIMDMFYSARDLLCCAGMCPTPTTMNICFIVLATYSVVQACPLHGPPWPSVRQCYVSGSRGSCRAEVHTSATWGTDQN